MLMMKVIISIIMMIKITIIINMGPRKRLIGSLIFLYIVEEEKAGGEERLSKHPKVSESILSSSPKPRQSVSGDSQSLPKASPKTAKASPKPRQPPPDVEITP